MAQATTKNRPSLTEGPLLPKLLWFTLPLIATGILQLLFNTADTVMVGRWGGSTPEECDTALAAVGSCGSLIALIINLFMGLSVGAGVCVAHDIGAGHEEGVKKTVHTSILASMMGSLAVTAFGVAMSRPLLALMGTDATVLDQAVPYMCAYFCGMPANMLYNYCAAMLRSSGDTARPLAFLSVAGVLNVLLNFIFVFFLRMGALGVGIATALSQWVSGLLILGYMMHYDGPCRVDWREMRIDGGKLRKILMIGLPAGIQSVLFSFSNVLSQSAVNSFGKSVVAGNTAAAILDSYVYAAQNALYHTTLTFVGQSFGANKLDRMKRSILLCAVSVVIVGLSVGFLIVFFGEPLMRIFAPESQAVVDAGVVRLSVIGTFYFLCGLMEVGTGALRGLGRSSLSTAISIFGSCILSIVWIYTVFAAFPTQTVLYFSYPVTWTITATAQFICCAVVIKRLKSGNGRTP